MAIDKDESKAPVWMVCDSLKKSAYTLDRAVVRETMSGLTETTVSFLHEDPQLDLTGLLGNNITLFLRPAEGAIRTFSGMIVSMEALGVAGGLFQYVAEVRPRFWLLTLGRNCRIFQDKTTVDIIKEVFNEAGLTEFGFSTSRDFVPRSYCVQYRESDYDFVVRLMEEDGLYFFFYHPQTAAGGSDKLVISDGDGHPDLAVTPKLPVHFGDLDAHRGACITEWTRARHMTFGKVRLQDYNFSNSQFDHSRTAEIETSTIGKDREFYDYPGQQLGGNGTILNYRPHVVRDAEAARGDLRSGSCNLSTMATGSLFTVEQNPQRTIPDGNVKFLVLSATHYIRDVGGITKDGIEIKNEAEETSRTRFPADMTDVYRSTFTALPSAVKYAAPAISPRPVIAGLQTAVVVGKSGEEIWTDEHGRIKVRFHWDRDSESDENSSCWVRVATPWSGKGWGMQAVPRMGSEVIIQFEEGDPDRPICTGMLYNDLFKPPYEQPSNGDMVALRTNTTKGGGGYNELSFKDVKNEEKVVFQSERDYEQIVKNNATVTIGAEHKDPGDYTRTVHNDVTETVTEGNQVLDIKKGSLTETIESNVTQTVTSGDRTLTVKKGDQTTTVEKGKISTTANLGDITITASAGTVTIEAASKIEFKVGGSKITMDPLSIKMETTNFEAKAKLAGAIEAMNMTVKGTATATFQSPMATVKGDAMLTLSGAMTMIN